jgi:DNA-binding MarR family transcriptional regulator
LPTQSIPRSASNRRLRPEEVEAFDAFLRASAALTHALERVAESRGGLPLSEHFVLVQVARGPETGVRPSDLARQSLLTKSGLTRALDRLEKDGLIGRRVCPSDKRGYFVVLTEKGRRLLKRAFPGHARAVARHFADPLAGSDLPTLVAALERIAAAA